MNMTNIEVGILVAAPALTYFIGRAIGKSEGLLQERTITQRPQYRASHKFVNEVVAQAEWEMQKNPWCSVGASNYEHDIEGSCPCI